jgi:hypothetical protein
MDVKFAPRRHELAAQNEAVSGMVDAAGNPPAPPLWMHVSKTTPQLNGLFVYSSDEYDDEDDDAPEYIHKKDKVSNSKSAKL